MKRTSSSAPASAGGVAPHGPLNVAVVGTRDHGRKHIDQLLSNPRCHVGYVCDVDTEVSQSAAAHVERKSGIRPRAVQDFREALADDTVDAVAVALPHHWHATAAIWSLQAGKHVYLEKPTTHVHAEAASLEAAAAKYPGFVQAGTQLRSNTSLARAGEFMRSGGIGDVDLVHCITYKPRPAMPPLGPVEIPASVDYDLWCGPAEMRPPERSRFHYHWHWFWEYGNGALGNNGVHRMDVARIGLGLEGLGDEVLSFGGRFGPADAGETPNTNVVIHRFGDTWVVHEILGLPTGSPVGFSNGIVFHGSTGTVAYAGGKASVIDEAGTVLQSFAGRQENHFDKFLAAVESNDSVGMTGSLAEANVSSSLCHVGNISYRLGMPVEDGAVDDAIELVGAPDAIRRLRERMRLNLVANGAGGDLTLGRHFRLAQNTEPFGDDAEASALLKKTYRAPFGVPAPSDV